MAQAHGPFLMHLQPRDRLRVLNSLASMYSCIGFRRKEVYILREVLAVVMDMVISSREETLASGQDPGGLRPGLGIAGVEMGHLGAERGVTVAPGSVAVRHNLSDEGNDSILKLVKHICEVFGVDLNQVSIAAASEESHGKGDTGDDVDDPRSGHYGWSELQLGVVREAVAVAEALPGLSMDWSSNNICLTTVYIQIILQWLNSRFPHSKHFGPISQNQSNIIFSRLL